MQHLDFDLSDISSNSFNNLSDLSLETPMEGNVQAGGGFHSFLFGSSVSDVDKAVLEAIKEKNMPVVEFMINKNLVSYKAQDKDGNTLLHYLVAVPNPNVGLIEKILNCPEVKSFINIQNNDGDTPLILAVSSGQHDLCTMLIKAGADKTIKNKKGHHVDTETEEGAQDDAVFHASVGPLSEASINIKGSPEDIKQIFEPFKRLLFRAKQQDTAQTSEPTSMTLADTNFSEPSTENFIREAKEKVNAKPVLTMNDTERIIQGLNAKHGGNIWNADTSDKLVTSIENYFMGNQLGGNRKTGTRRVQRYSEYDMNEAPKDDRHRLRRSRKARRVLHAFILLILFKAHFMRRVKRDRLRRCRSAPADKIKL
jgi:hypothetical protein